MLQIYKFGQLVATVANHLLNVVMRFLVETITYYLRNPIQ